MPKFKSFLNRHLLLLLPPLAKTFTSCLSSLYSVDENQLWLHLFGGRPGSLLPVGLSFLQILGSFSSSIGSTCLFQFSFHVANLNMLVILFRSPCWLLWSSLYHQSCSEASLYFVEQDVLLRRVDY